MSPGQAEAPLGQKKVDSPISAMAALGRKGNGGDQRRGVQAWIRNSVLKE